jgi:hypothetical protein
MKLMKILKLSELQLFGLNHFWAVCREVYSSSFLGSGLQHTTVMWKQDW